MAQDQGEWRLSDQQWDKIKEISCLPPEARGRIESIIRTYVSLQEERPSPIRPAEIKGKLRKLSNLTKKLLKSLEKAFDDDDVYLALVQMKKDWQPLEWPPHLPEHHRDLTKHNRRIEKTKADLGELIDWFDQSDRRLKRSKPGRSSEYADAIFPFILEVDDTLHHYTKKRLTRSKRHRWLMGELFRITDREVGTGMIDTVMKKVTAITRSRPQALAKVRALVGDLGLPPSTPLFARRGPVGARPAK